MNTPEDSNQNIREGNCRDTEQSAQETDPTYTPTIEGFLQDVEQAVCGKIVEIGLASSFDAPALRSKTHKKPNAVGRQMVWYLLYNHPYVAGAYSTPAIGKIYKRDHTTVIYGIERIGTFICRPHVFGHALQSIADSIADRYGPFDLGCPPMPVRPAEPEKPDIEPVMKVEPKRTTYSTKKCSGDKIRQARIDRDRKIAKLFHQGVERCVLGERFGVSKTQVALAIATYGDAHAT